MGFSSLRQGLGEFSVTRSCIKRLYFVNAIMGMHRCLQIHPPGVPVNALAISRRAACLSSDPPSSVGELCPHSFFSREMACRPSHHTLPPVYFRSAWYKTTMRAKLNLVEAKSTIAPHRWMSPPTKSPVTLLTAFTTSKAAQEAYPSQPHPKMKHTHVQCPSHTHCWE